jgi:hypothetical protein
MTKIVVFKKGAKLSKYENWKMGGEEIEVANEIPRRNNSGWQR